MPEEFSIPDLLSLLQVDRQNAAIQLSLEADRLCRLREYKPAIDVAESATQLVRTDPWLLGVTLLYLSYARLCSDLPEQVRQAARECDRAIRTLGLSTYNYAIANLIHGQMDLQVHSIAGRASALRSFERASEVLEKLRAEETLYNRAERAARCVELKAKADQQIRQLTQKMTEPAEVKVPPKQMPPKPAAPAPQPAPDKAASKKKPAAIPLGEQMILKRLVWPPQEPPLIFDVPTVGGGSMPDFLGIRQLSLHNRLYDVLPIVGDEPIQLRPRQNYWVVPLEGAQRGELALIRERTQPDQVTQFIAVDEPVQQRVWIDKAEFTEDLIHIIGAERKWHIHDSVERMRVTNLRIIGIVEAVLVPIDA